MCYRTSGKSEDTCPGHNNNACKKVHCKCIGSNYQQSSCEDCSNCKIQPCICEQRGKQCRKEKAICDCGMTCQQSTSDCSYCSACQKKESSDEQRTCCKICCKNCGEPDRGIHCSECQEIITDCNCVPQTQTREEQTRRQGQSPKSISKWGTGGNGA